jgi:hypothetical protein
LLEFHRAQDIDVFQHFTGMGSELSQTGHTFSGGLTIGVSLQLGHLTGWTLIRLISMLIHK